jgi:hypothetical protein
MVHSQLGLKSEGSQLSDAEQAIEGEKDGLSPVCIPLPWLKTEEGPKT